MSGAYWILENSSSNPGLIEFVEDPGDPDHYLLTITEDMKIADLIFKLRWIAKGMAAMSDLTLEASKGA